MTKEKAVEVIWRQICLDRHGGYPVEGEKTGGYWYLWVPQAKKDAAAIYAALESNGFIISHDNRH